ncbi:hypothetical protein PilKf_01595 [Pillotina sp. SPG140]|jgi:hypothetical protein
MAKEFKTLNVAPGGENKAIEFWQHFGWELMGAPQEIYSKDSHLEKSGDTIKSVTETTHYIKLSFQRDTTMNHYSELASLQKEYEAIPDPSDPPKKFGILFLILMGFSLALGIYSISGAAEGGILLAFIFFPLAVLIFIWRTKRYKKLYPEWESVVNDIATRRDRVLKRAKVLIA